MNNATESPANTGFFVILFFGKFKNSGNFVAGQPHLWGFFLFNLN